MQFGVPLRTRLSTTHPVLRQTFLSPHPMLVKPEVQRAFVTATLQNKTPHFLKPRDASPAGKLVTTIMSNDAKCQAVPGILGGVRAMSSWRLRPYATAGALAVTPLGTLSAGFSKVGLSLLVLPWKALPMALVLAPACWMLPTFYRMIFTNSMRATTASAFSSLLALTVSFAPVPVFENLFSDFAFYSVALVTSFFTYMFFPELFLNDFMAMHFFVLFMIPLIPLAFTYMPMMHARTYLFL